MDLACIAFALACLCLAAALSNARRDIRKANETIKSMHNENVSLMRELQAARVLADRTVDMPEPKHDLSRWPLGYNSTDEHEL
jgi:hypothetical protein